MIPAADLSGEWSSGQTPEPARKRRNRWFLPLLLAPAVVCFPFLLVIQTPAYWPPPDEQDASLAPVAQNFENRLISELSRVRDPDQTWVLTVTADDLNAWLANRLKPWLVNQRSSPELAKNLRGIMAHFSEDQMELAAQIDGTPLNGVLRLQGQFNREAGLLNFHFPSARCGALPIPQSLIPDSWLSTAGLSSARPLVRPLGDGRVVEAIDYHLQPGRLELICRTRQTGAATTE